MDRRTLLLSASAGVAGCGLVRLANAMGPANSSHVPRLGMNLTQITYYTQSPFIDRIKTSAGEWQYQGVTNPPPPGPTGLPTSMGGAAIVQMMVSLDPLPNGKSALYELSYDGDATFEMQYAQIVSTQRGKVVFRFSGPNFPVGLILRSIGRTPPTRITLVRRDHAALFAAGEIFTPEFLQQVDGFDTLRFMDWMLTNGSRVTDTLPPVAALTYAGGVPLEVMIALANKTGASPWVNIPHLATDALISDILAKLKAGLRSGIVPTIEYSNEVWNPGFPQQHYAAAQAASLWGQGTPGNIFYGYRSGQIAKMARGTGARVVLGCQTVQPYLSEQVFKGVALAGAVDRDFWGWIIATYISGTLNEAKGPALQFMAANDIDGAIDNILNATGPGAFSVRSMAPVWAAHGKVAAAHGLKLTAYEGNLHLTSIPNLVPHHKEAAAFFKTVIDHPDSAKTIRAMLDAFVAAGGQLECFYNLSSGVSEFGVFGMVDTPSWGFIRRNLGQPAGAAAR